MTTINLNKDNFEAEVTKSEIPVIVDFWAQWCMPCQMMGPVFEELSGEYSGKLKFGKVNTEEERELSAVFQIRSIPTLMIVYKEKIIDQIFGFAQKEALKEKIDKILERIK